MLGRMFERAGPDLHLACQSESLAKEVEKWKRLDILRSSLSSSW